MAEPYKRKSLLFMSWFLEELKNKRVVFALILQSSLFNMAGDSPIKVQGVLIEFEDLILKELFQGYLLYKTFVNQIDLILRSNLLKIQHMKPSIILISLLHLLYSSSKNVLSNRQKKQKPTFSQVNYDALDLEIGGILS